MSKVPGKINKEPAKLIHITKDMSLYGKQSM